MKLESLEIYIYILYILYILYIQETGGEAGEPGDAQVPQGQHPGPRSGMEMGLGRGDNIIVNAFLNMI